MTYEQYLLSQGYFYVPSQGSGEDATRGGWARTVGGGDDSYTQFLEGDNEENTLRGYQSALQQTQPTTQPTPIVEPTAQRDKEILDLISTTTPSTTAQPTTLPAPKSLDEYLQQQGYEYRPELQDTYAASWGKYRDDGEGGRIFDTLESQTAQKYYQDPTRFIQNRETQFGKGINTFNEGNSQQKSVIDQINSGQLYIAPRIERGRGEDQGYAESTSYELRDSKTGNVVNQQVIPIDIEKGVYSILADDPNSSGFFNNYVSTDPKGFVNPIVSEEQSQYSSRANSSANFYRNSILATIQMATGAGMLGSVTSLATSIGTSLGFSVGSGALTVGSAILGSATSSVLAAVTGGDIVKSAIAGGITAGAGANASDIGTAIAGGADNVKAIADALDLTTKQVTTAISNAVTSGVVSAAVTGTDVTTAITSTLASSAVGSYTDNLLANIPDLKDSATLISNVAKITTKAVVSGTDVGDALVNSIPSIIGGLVDDPKATGTKLKEEIVAEVADETKTETASTIEVGDTSDQPPGTEVLLADGTTGRVSNSGVIEASDATSDITTVGFKEPTGTVSVISDAVLASDAIIQNTNSPTGFSDVSGNPINEDGTAYLDPNAVDVAPDNVNVTTAKDQEILDLINSVVKKDETVATNVADTTTGTTVDPTTVKTDTTDVTNIVDPTATTTATTVADTTGATGTTGGVTDITDTTGVIDTTTGVDTGGVSTTTSGGTGTDVVGTGVDTGGGFRGTTTDTTTTVDPNQEILDLIATSTPLKTDTVDTTTTTETTPTKTDLTTEPITVTGTQDPTVDTTTVTQEEEVKPYTPFEEDFPLQTDEEKLRISPTVIPKRPSQPSRTAKNARLSTGLGIDTNVASLLGTGLPSRPDVSSTSEPYLLGKDDKRKDVWNTESLRGALGI
jgi:hypothetical protein